MQINLKTILNFKENWPRFVCKDARLNEIGSEPRIEIKVVARKGSQGICSNCNKACPGYDHLKEREFIHVPFWGITVILLYCMRRL